MGFHPWHPTDATFPVLAPRRGRKLWQVHTRTSVISVFWVAESELALIKHKVLPSWIEIH